MTKIFCKRNSLCLLNSHNCEAKHTLFLMYAKASVKDYIMQLYLTSFLLFAFPFFKTFLFPFLPLLAPSLSFLPSPSPFRVTDFSHDVML